MDNNEESETKTSGEVDNFMQNNANTCNSKIKDAQQGLVISQEALNQDVQNNEKHSEDKEQLILGESGLIEVEETNPNRNFDSEVNIPKDANDEALFSPEDATISKSSSNGIDISASEDATLNDKSDLGNLGASLDDVSKSVSPLLGDANEPQGSIETEKKFDNESGATVSPENIGGGAGEEELDTTSDPNGDTNLDDSQQANGGINRPDSLSLPRPLQFYERQKQGTKQRKDSSESGASESFSHSSSTDALIEMVSSTPLTTQGTVMKDGDMMSFIAEDLNEKIKMSSPLTKAGSWTGSSTPGALSTKSFSSSTSGWSSSSASGWSHLSNQSGVSRSPSVLTQSPEDIPPIDPRALMDLEYQARNVAESVDEMMNNLKTNIHRMSGITANCLDAYKDAVDNTCDAVDGSIKSMYALMAKCEELTKGITPIYPLAEQIKEIKRLLDLFELQMARDEK